jgi:DNA-directed RNA polymerase specialized sigma subunit
MNISSRMEKNILDYLKNNNINLKLKNINRSELKISTADTQYLNSLFCEIKFRQINDYLKKELNI